MSWMKSVGAAIVGAVGIAAAWPTLHEYFEKKINIEVTGWWNVDFTVESTSYRPYKGMVYGYRIVFSQNGKDVEGIGEKWTEDGRELPSVQHMPIRLKGISSQTQVKLTYELKGTKRETLGSIVLESTKDPNLLQGTFTGTAADVKGTVVAHRAPQAVK